MEKDNLKNSVCLVTGGAGFIGSELVRQLLNERVKVIVFDNMLVGDESNLEEVENRIQLIKGDIRDKEIFKKSLMENKVEYVFNLAAEPYIPHCYERPQEFFSINANGALNVLLTCKEAKVKRIIQYSTSEIYGSGRFFPMDENHPINPMSTYAVSKLAADRLAFTLYHEQKIPVIALRQFNAYGPRECQPYILPEIISQLSRSNKLLLGNIKARRDFTYVEDAAKSAIELMKHKEAEGGVFNSGSGIDYSVEELVYIIGELMGHDNIKIEIDPKRLRPLDVERLQCNYFKLHMLTGWKPLIGIREGLKRTIEWFNKNNKVWMWEKRFPMEKVWGKGIWEKES